MSSSNLREFSAKLGGLSTVLAHRVAAASADKITELSRGTFDASQDTYGTPWAPGADGKPVDLEETGALKSKLSYVATGSKIRCSLGVKYAKYQIGKRPVIPRGALPKSYVEALAAVLQDEARKALEVT